MTDQEFLKAYCAVSGRDEDALLGSLLREALGRLRRKNDAWLEAFTSWQLARGYSPGTATMRTTQVRASINQGGARHYADRAWRLWEEFCEEQRHDINQAGL